MPKKKRLKKLTVFGCVEGGREQAFLDFLREIYQPDLNNIAFYPENANGGGADSIVTPALNKSDRDKSFAWLDEDFEPDKSPLSQDVRTRLANNWNVKNADKVRELIACPIGKLQSSFNPANERKPTLIVSQPVCSESMILQTLGQCLPYASYDPTQREAQIAGLKDKLNQLMGGAKTVVEQVVYYRRCLTKEQLEDRRNIIPELDLLISMITK